VPKELAIGLGVSAAFGSLVLLADLASRLFIEGGVQQHLLSRQFPTGGCCTSGGVRRGALRGGALLPGTALRVDA
jgi:hypothetical protein